VDTRGLVRRLFRRDRVTGQVAIVMVAVLAIAAVVYGVGMASARYQLADVGAWLVSNNGPAVHVNGLSGKVDGKTGLPGSNGHKMRVVQDHGTVLIIDETTGVVSRIDPTQLQVAQTRKLGASGTQVVAGKNAAYTVDPKAGRVQRIDPVTLATKGNPVKLPAPLGQAAIDGHSVLWVPVPASGQSAPVTNGQAGRPVAVGHAGDRLSLTVAAGLPVVVNSTSATAMVVSAGSQQLRVSLPSSVRHAGFAGVLAPSTTDGQVVPLLAEKAGALVLVNTGDGGLKATSVRLPRHRYAAPQILGSRVYIPDESTGRVFVYDTATNHFMPSIPVSGHPGALDAFVKDGLLWINDPNGSTALVINDHGTVHRISKYTGKVPGGPRKTVPGTPHVGSTGGKNNGNGGQNGNNGGGHRGGDRGNGRNGDRGRKPDNRGSQAPPTRSPRPTHSTRPPVTKTLHPAPPKPGSPSNVTTEPQPGGVQVSFDASTSGKPDGYELVAPSGFTVTPKKAGASGPYEFTAKGGDCGTEVTFRVAALYNGTKKLSDPSEPVQPCVTPGAPQNLKADAVNHGANLTWSAPTNSSGGTAYEVSGGATGTATATNFSASGLTNNQTYTFNVKAKNAAGESAPATAPATLTPKAADFKNTYNDDTDTKVRAAPDPNSDMITYIDKGVYTTFSIQCQANGGLGKDQYHDRSSTIWDKVTYKGKTGYVNDIFFATPQSGTNNFSDPPLWGCS
jgi:hypothetical protein